MDNLNEDHRHILAALDAVDLACALAGHGIRHLPVFEAAHRFIVVFADGAHYEKEEILFEAVRASGAPCMAGPVGVLMFEHDATRELSARMAQAIAAINKGQADAWPVLVDAAARYSAIVRGHLPKEHFGFFPMSGRALPADVQANLEGKFLAIDAGLPESIERAANALRDAVVALVPKTGMPKVVDIPAGAADRPTAHARFYELTDARLDSALQSLAKNPATPFG